MFKNLKRRGRRDIKGEGIVGGDREKRARNKFVS